MWREVAGEGVAGSSGRRSRPAATTMAARVDLAYRAAHPNRGKGERPYRIAIAWQCRACATCQMTAPTERDVTVLGTIERFTFRNPDTGWAVVRLLDEAAGRPITAVGSMAQLTEGQRLKITGKEANHPRFGVQVKVETFEPIAPTTAEGIEAYLASGLVKGVGPATAKKIVQALGNDALRIIEEEPERVRKIRGLNARKAEDLSTAVRAQKDLQ